MLGTTHTCCTEGWGSCPPCPQSHLTMTSSTSGIARGPTDRLQGIHGAQVGAGGPAVWGGPPRDRCVCVCVCVSACVRVCVCVCV